MVADACVENDHAPLCISTTIPDMQSVFTRIATVLFALATSLPLSSAQGASVPEPPSPSLRLGVFFWHRSANDLVAFEGMKRAFEIRGLPHEFDVQHADGDERRAREILDKWKDKWKTGSIDLLFTMGTRATFLAQGWVGRLPIVFAAVTNPVEAGIVSSWRSRYERSATLVRLTGTSNWIPPQTVLHVFRLAVPRLRRLGVLRSTDAGYVSAVELRGLRQAIEAGDPAERIEVVESVYERRLGIERTVEALIEADVDAIWIPIDYTIYQQSKEILDAVASRGIPLLSSSLRATRDAAIAGVVVDYRMLGQRAAALALQILEKGRAPERIPVETMKGYQIVVNLEAARRCGYELPLPLLVVADRVWGTNVVEARSK